MFQSATYWIVVSLLWLIGGIFTATPVFAADPLYILQRDGLLMVFNSVDLMIRNKEATDIVQSVSYEVPNDNSTTVKKTGEDDIEVNLVFLPKKDKGLVIEEFSILMNFTKGGGYWWLNGANLNLKGSDVASFVFQDQKVLSEITLGAPIERSFHCSRFGSLFSPQKVGNHTFAIDFRGFQIQPFANATAFSEAYECVGFFSIGILSGIFITIILMAVISWGLVMIMNVKTMDRFDDPKGKPISFGGSD